MEPDWERICSYRQQRAPDHHGNRERRNTAANQATSRGPSQRDRGGFLALRDRAVRGTVSLLRIALSSS